MSQISFLNGRVTLHGGDCLDVIKTLAAASIDSVVTDPPYGLEFMSVAWDTFSDRPKGTARVRNEWKDFGSREHPRNASEAARIAGKKSLAFYAFSLQWAREVLRVLKPGGHLIAFGGTRTYHRLACAIEDAGFEIRDQLAWAYGSDFPKSHDVSKGIDKAAAAEREVVGEVRRSQNRSEGWDRPWMREQMDALGGNGMASAPITAPATDAARRWSGWGTALKPAWEPIVLARKPLGENTVASNVLAHGTGALNIDGCRVGIREKPKITHPKHCGHSHNTYGAPSGGGRLLPDARWPANLCHDGSPEVLAGFPDAGGGFGKRGGNENSTSFGFKIGSMETVGFGDSGSAARFFYSAKADSDDRIGSKHPTIKPVDLMQWLVRLVTPPGGTVLDPFSGSGSTGEAAWREGFYAILIEREAEYQADIARRIDHALKSERERSQTIVVARGTVEDAGPLFGGISEIVRGGGQEDLRTLCRPMSET